MQDEETAAKILAYMSQHGLTQQELADKAHVSQPTVSRAINGRRLRRGAARRKLFTCVGIDESRQVSVLLNARKRVLAAFERIWDRTDAHAEAIARVIDALGEFRTKSGGNPEE